MHDLVDFMILRSVLLLNLSYYRIPFQYLLPNAQFVEGDAMKSLFQSLAGNDARFFFQFFSVFSQVDQIGTAVFLSEMRTTRCCRSILSIKRVMLGLSLKVALHNSCCVTPSFPTKNEYRPLFRTDFQPVLTEVTVQLTVDCRGNFAI